MRGRSYWKIIRRIASAWIRRDHDQIAVQKRLLGMRLLMGEAETVTFRMKGVLWTTPVSDRDITRSLFVSGEHEGANVANMQAWLTHHGFMDDSRHWIIDIGANIGTPCIPLVRETGKKVLAVEPSPVNFALLERNVSQNGFDDRIDCVQCAVSDENGEVTLVIHPCGGRNEVETEGREQGFGRVDENFHKARVPARRLDDLLHEKKIPPDDVALVWSDTQGFERQVISSASSVWSAGVPLLCELWPQGLRAHGGLDPFIATAEITFKGFVPTDDMEARGAEAQTRPISELRTVLGKLTGKKHSDAIFLPH